MVRIVSLAPDISATEAAELLGLTRERLRQLSAAGELPDRIPASSRFRPRYLRESVEAFGRATGRIVDTETPPPMQLVVDQLLELTPTRTTWESGVATVAHARVWRRRGWLPLVLLGAPIDADSALRSATSSWEAEVRRRFAPDAPFVSLWLYAPDGRPDPATDLPAAPLYLERNAPTSWREDAEPGRLGEWSERSHDDLERRVGAAVATLPGAVYTTEVIQRVLDAQGKRIEIEWDPYDLTGLADAALLLTDQAASFAEDARIVVEGARFIALMARIVDEVSREAMPPASALVAVKPTELDPATWARIDALAAEVPAQPASGKRTGRTREDLVLLRRDLERILEEGGDAIPWRLREAVDRARRFIPPVGDPDR
jgi:hypothetical protein